MGMTRTERNLWSAFLGEAKANRMYTAYALKALDEGLPEVAQVFMEAAGGETIHALSHLRVMDELGSSAENLRRVVDEEAYELETMYPRMIQEALDEGRPDAAGTFRQALEGERHHVRVFQEALRNLEKKTAAPAAPPRPKTAVEALDLAAPPAETGPASEIDTEKGRIEALSRIREVIFGMQDGLLTTAALAASVTAAVGGGRTVVIAALAAAFAGMLSMAAGSYLGSKAEREVHTAEIEREAREIEQHPAEELAELIEIYRREGFTYEEAVNMAERIASDRQLWLSTLAEKELGLSAEAISSPTKDAAAMGASYIVGAFIPLFPYFALEGGPAIGISVALAVGTLFVMGAAKARLVGRNPLISGLEMLVIGCAVAGAGYGLGAILGA
jgi:VIT1/CCC1 family predicted Fe2+/Mn2+ transporter/rubrerythrin